LTNIKKRVLNRDSNSRLFLSFCSGQVMAGLFLDMACVQVAFYFFAALIPAEPSSLLGFLADIILLSFMRKRLLGLLFK